MVFFMLRVWRWLCGTEKGTHTHDKMKRVALFEESAGDERRQAALQALLMQGVELALSQVVPLVQAFRFHPWRLMRLMAAHPRLRAAVERLERELLPQLWYDAALHAFPDTVLLFRISARMPSLVRTQAQEFLATGAQLSLLHCLYGGQWTTGGLRALVDETMRTADEGAYDVRPRDTTGHASFRQLGVLDRCMRDDAYARRVARAFRLVYPFALPPAQYCFESQAMLSVLVAQYATLLVSLEELTREQALLRSPLHDFPITVRMRHMEGSLRMQAIPARVFALQAGITIEAVLGYATQPFSLDDLATALERSIERGEVNDLAAAHNLKARVLRAHYRCMPETEFVAAVERALAGAEREARGQPDLRLGETIDALRAVRAHSLARHGHVDPLLWSVQLRDRPGDEPSPLDPPTLSDGSAIDWRRVCRARINLVKARRLQAPEEYARTEAHWALGALGATARLEGAGERCQLRLEETRLWASFACAVVLDEPERALLGDADEELGLARGTLCWPRLRLAYRFTEGYAFLLWLDFDLPVTEAEASHDATVKLRLGDAKVRVSERVLVEAALELTRPYGAQGRPRLGAELRLVAAAAHSGELDEVAAWDADLHRYYYESARSVLAHMIYLHSQEAAQAVAQAISGELRRYERKLVVASVQDYVAHALAPLGHLGQSRPAPHQEGGRHLVFALPALAEPTWPGVIRDYIVRQDYTPASGMLRKARHVTIVARASVDGPLLGYVTCALYGPLRQPAAPAMDAWPPALRHFARARNENVWDLLLIEGISVEREWRGGRDTSLAVLLVFHALYFALQCARDCGLARVACESAARTTALIMRQFGGVHAFPRRAVDWMEQRLEAGLPVADDLAAFGAEYPDSVALTAGLPAAEAVAALRAELPLERGRAWAAPLGAMEDLIKTGGSDTFLSLDNNNERLHAQMARLERLLTQQAEKQARPTEQEEDLQGDERRKRARQLGTSLTRLPWAALDSFKLEQS